MSNNWPRTCLCIRTHSHSFGVLFSRTEIAIRLPNQAASIRQVLIEAFTEASSLSRFSSNAAVVSFMVVMLFLRGLRNRERLFLLERLFVTANLGAVGFRGDLEALL